MVSEKGKTGERIVLHKQCRNTKDYIYMYIKYTCRKLRGKAGFFLSLSPFCLSPLLSPF